MIGAMTWNQPSIKPKKTTRRDEIFLFIAEFAVEHLGNTPSIGEVALAFDISRATAYSHMLKLVNDGRGRWHDGEFILIGSEFSPPPDNR